MPSSPNQLPSGQQFELRVTASNLELDAHLAEQTTPENRQDLPGYLHLFYEKPFNINDDDRDIEGRSFKEMQRQGLQMKVSSYTRNKFSLSPFAEKVEVKGPIPEWRIRLELQLGLQASKAILIEPFFSADERKDGVIPMYYTIPNAMNFDKKGRSKTSDNALLRLQEYLDEKPHAIVDELMLVKTAVRQRSIRNRNRANALQLPSVAKPLEVIELNSFEEYGYDTSVESAS